MGHLSRIAILGDNPRAAQIAAWLANCGCDVHLLGVVAKVAFDLEPIAKACLYVPEFQSRIKVGLVRDNLEALRKATWIHDCHSLNADLKDSLYTVIDTAMAPDALVTTDDTLLPLDGYTNKRSSLLSKRFFILEFAQPYVRPELAEYALTDQTDVQRAESFVREIEGATGVRCLQTPYSTALTVRRATLLYCILAISVAEKLQLDVDQADRYAEVLGLTQAFRYVDESVFNDTVTYGFALCQEYGLPGLPRSLRALYDNPKHSHGFYSSETGQAVVLDLQTLAYRGSADIEEPNLDQVKRLPPKQRMAAALTSTGPFGEYAREINKAIGTIANWMRQGKGVTDERLQLALRHGIGIRSVDHGHDLSKDESAPTLRMPTTIGMRQAKELADAVEAKGLEPFILIGEDEGFCNGFDIEELLRVVAEEGRDGLLEYCQTFQRLSRALGSARCVATVHGVCAGFGLEAALACSQIVIDAGTQVAMDHARFGIMPMAGGSIRLRVMGQSEGAKRLAEIAHVLASGKVPANAFEARRLGLIPGDSIIVTSRRFLLESAKIQLGSLPDRRQADWQAVTGPLAGMIDQIRLSAKQKGEIGQHGEILMEKAKALLTKPTSILAAQDLETETFLDLASRALSHARMRYTSSTGKVLNN